MAYNRLQANKNQAPSTKELRKKTNTKKGLLSQNEFDSAVVQFIIDGIEPLRTVEQEHFKAYTNGNFLATVTMYFAS